MNATVIARHAFEVTGFGQLAHELLGEEGIAPGAFE